MKTKTVLQISLAFCLLFGNVVMAQTQVKTIPTTSIKAKLYFESIFTDDNGNITSKKLGERTDFATKKKYTFCYDSETFNNITLEGNATDVSFVIKSRSTMSDKTEKIIFKKEHITITNKLQFTSADFTLDAVHTYYISITQGAKTIFEGTIDSQSCM